MKGYTWEQIQLTITVEGLTHAVKCLNTALCRATVGKPLSPKAYGESVMRKTKVRR